MEEGNEEMTQKRRVRGFSKRLLLAGREMAMIDLKAMTTHEQGFVLECKQKYKIEECVPQSKNRKKKQVKSFWNDNLMLNKNFTKKEMHNENHKTNKIHMIKLQSQTQKKILKVQKKKKTMHTTKVKIWFSYQKKGETYPKKL